MPSEPVPSQSERQLERYHILSTVVTYPGMSTQDVRDRANNEAQHDLFDPLPIIEPQAIAPKLKSLERDGLISGWVDFDGARWDPTDTGREAWAAEESRLDIIYTERING